MSEDIFFSCTDLVASSGSARPAINETLLANCIPDFDTQPVSNSLGDNLQNAGHQAPPWGLLFGLSHDMPRTQLTLDEYVIGRNDGSPVNIILPRPPDSEKNKLNMWLSYSRVQFKIRRNALGVVEIEDASSNGTFVNGLRLVKGEATPLENNSEIALSLTKNKVMMYVDLSILDDPSIPATLRNQFRFSKQLGQGACGEVQLAFIRHTGQPVAIKIVHRSRFFTEVPKDCENDKKKPGQGDNKHSSYAQAVREAKLMQKLSHPCIIKIIDIFDEPGANDMYLILEYAPGGELFDKIVGNGKLTESFAKYIFFQVLLAVQYLHSQGITHRDLKPENVLLSSDDDYPIAKLADFGLSKIVGPATMLRTYCGTPTYLAPEIIRTKGTGGYSKKVDLWSLGVILFAALAGYPPFYAERPEMTLEQQIIRGYYSFPAERWAGVSQEAISLIKALLTVDPNRRPSADQAVVNAWIATDRTMIDKVSDVVFGGHGVRYYWSSLPPKEVKAVPGLSASSATTSSRGRGTKVAPAVKPKVAGRLSVGRANDKNSTEDSPPRPSTAEGTRPTRGKKTTENPRGALNMFHNSNRQGKVVTPAPAKRGVAGEKSRPANSNLTDAKTPKIAEKSAGGPSKLFQRGKGK